MASVSPHKVQHCGTHKGEKATKAPKGCRRCKVLAWRLFYKDADGKPRSQVFDGAKMANPKEAANARKAEVEKALRDGTYIDPAAPKMLYLDFADQWAAAREWKQASRDIWPSLRKRHAKYVGERATLGSIDRLRLEAIRQDLAAVYAPNTVAGTMHQIMAIMKMAVATGKIARDPTVTVKAKPKRRADDPTRQVTPDMVPTAAEAWSILDSSPIEWQAAHALGLAGLRIGEVMGMERDNVNLATGEITIARQAVSLKGKGVLLTTTKAEKVRTIEPADEVMAVLAAHINGGYGGGTWVDANGTEHEMLFLHTNGNLLRHGQFYDAAYDPALEAAELAGRFTFHGYRHHVASQLLSDGADLATVAGFIGDHIHTVTRVYAHWLRDKKQVPRNILNRLYAQTPRRISRLPHAA